MARGNPTLNVRYPRDVLARLRQVAEATGQTMGDIVRDATMAALAQYPDDLGHRPQIDGQQSIDELTQA